MSDVLVIAGSTVDFAATDVVINSLELRLDGPDVLEFSQVGVKLPPSWKGGQEVTLTIDGTMRFVGTIVLDGPRLDERLGWVRGYRAEGMAWRANTIPFTNPRDGTQGQTFNLKPSDGVLNYFAADSGLTVGQIAKRVLDTHQTYTTPPPGLVSLADLGIHGLYTFVGGEPAYLVDPLDLTITPPDAVTIGGERLWDAVVAFVRDWYPTVYPRIDVDGYIRFYDTTRFVATTLTLGTDPIEPPALARETGDCWTRVQVRGSANVRPVLLTLASGLLARDWTSGDTSAWSLKAFRDTLDAASKGTCTVTSSTTVSCTVTEGLTTPWTTDYWGPSQRAAWIYLEDPVASGIDILDSRPVVSNTGNVITVDPPLDATGYTKFHLIGKGTTAGSKVWRRYKITDATIAAHLVARFPRPVPFYNASGTGVVLTSYPIATVMWSPSGVAPFHEWQANMEIDLTDPSDPAIVFAEPVVVHFGTQAKLEQGGNAVDGIPNDIRVLVALSKGAFTGTAPADAAGVPQYSGTAHSVDGIARTHYVEFPSYNFIGMQSDMNTLAGEILKTVGDAVVEGSVGYHGRYDPALAFGIALRFAGQDAAAYDTGAWSVEAIPVRSVRLEWGQGTGDAYHTTMGISSRHKQFTGFRLYEHPGFAAILYPELFEPLALGFPVDHPEPTSSDLALSSASAFGSALSSSTLPSGAEAVVPGGSDLVLPGGSDLAF